MNANALAAQPAGGVSGDVPELPVFQPHVDLLESDKKITLIADMPGVDETTVEVEVEKKILSIRGSVTPPRYEGYHGSYVEYEYGNYEREFRLSEAIDQDQIEATVSNGVLRVALPKLSDAASKKIAVKAAR